MQIPARTPAMTAMTAATIDALSGGRFRLGLGVSGPQVSEGWHGVRFAKPLARTREYVDIVKHGDRPRAGVLRRRALHAAAARTARARRCGSASTRRATHIPIYLAAVGPKNLELAGEIADGWLAIFFAPEYAAEQLALDRARAGPRPARRWTASTSSRRCRWSSATTSPPAPTLVRWYAALYVGGMGSREQNFYNQLATRMGYGDAAREVQDLYLAGKQREAAAAVPHGVHRPDLAARAEGAHRRADAGVRRRRGHHPVADAVRRPTGTAASRRCAPARRRWTWPASATDARRVAAGAPSGGARRVIRRVAPPPVVSRRRRGLGWGRGDPPAPATRPDHLQRRRRTRRAATGRAGRDGPRTGRRGRRAAARAAARGGGQQPADPLPADPRAGPARRRTGRRRTGSSSAATATGRGSRSRRWPRIRSGRWSSSTPARPSSPRGSRWRRCRPGRSPPYGAGMPASTPSTARRRSGLACSHGDVIKAIVADALGLHLDLFQRIVVDPAR